VESTLIADAEEQSGQRHAGHAPILGCLVPPRPLADEEKFNVLRATVEKHFQVRIVEAKRSMRFMF
jgi:hypothetical protein